MFVDASSMQSVGSEGDAWVASHDMHQALGVNLETGSFAGAGGVDAYPKGVICNVKSRKGVKPSGPEHHGKYNIVMKHWGSGSGYHAARFGQMIGDGDGFLLAWSAFAGDGVMDLPQPPHEVMVSKLTASGGNRPGFPKKLTHDGVDKQDVSVVPFDSGYLVGYVVSKQCRKGWSDMSEAWRGVCTRGRDNGDGSRDLGLQYSNTQPSRLFRLDGQGNKIGEPEALPRGKNLLEHGGGLTRRAGGEIVWITGITKESFRIARLR